MPPLGSINARRSGWSWLVKGIVSLVVTVLLCLPSLVGGAALLMNRMVYPDMREWSQISSALVALGVFFGRPLAEVAAIVGGIIALRRSVSLKIKYAHLLVVGLGTIASLFLSFQLGVQ